MWFLALGLHIYWVFCLNTRFYPQTLTLHFQCVSCYAYFMQMHYLCFPVLIHKAFHVSLVGTYRVRRFSSSLSLYYFHRLKNVSSVNLTFVIHSPSTFNYLFSHSSRLKISKVKTVSSWRTPFPVYVRRQFLWSELCCAVNIFISLKISLYLLLIHFIQYIYNFLFI